MSQHNLESLAEQIGAAHRTVSANLLTNIAQLRVEIRERNLNQETTELLLNIISQAYDTLWALIRTSLQTHFELVNIHAGNQPTSRAPDNQEHQEPDSTTPDSE